jgi:hypothetical protein
MNPAILNELADREAELLSIVKSATGLMEEKAKQLERLGVYARYLTIYSEYQALLTSPACSLEALKRVVFLCWYSKTEPLMFTGLARIPSDMPSVYPLLDRDRASAEPDPELSRMLPWYYFITDFAFPNLAAAPHLASFLASADPHAYLSRPSDERRMENRGQMGEYWDSLGQAIPLGTTPESSEELRQLKKELARLQRRSFWSRSSGALRSKWTRRGRAIQK